MNSLEGKVVLITGGTRGIGRGIVKTFHAKGAIVVFSYMSSEEKARTLEESLGGERILGVQSDASEMSQAQELTKVTIDKFGRIDALINNAGITKDNLLLRMSEDQWNDVIKINLNSVFNLTKCAIRPMLKQRSGSIINMSSIVGITGNAGQSNYAASKAGIIGFTKSIAKEIGSRGIRCNAIAPGFIQTEMTGELSEQIKEEYIKSIPLKSFGTVDDIAEACHFLVSDASRYITGQVLSVCGGMNI